MEELTFLSRGQEDGPQRHRGTEKNTMRTLSATESRLVRLEWAIRRLRVAMNQADEAFRAFVQAVEARRKCGGG